MKKSENVQIFSQLVKLLEAGNGKWIGHVLRMERNDITRVALIWAPEGRWKVGRPKENWRRTVEKERNQLGYRTWGEAEVAAQGRGAWRKRDASGPILQ